jgi:mannose/cellobiose epimerase-like protein (N-acyl-D-glucosamine 2-epimerase family)
MQKLHASNQRLKSWIKEQALPLWATRGIDPMGGFWESLALDATPVTDSLRRVRVQARLTHTYAHAAYLGWYKGAHQASDHGWAYLTQQGMQGGARGCAHLLNPDGSLHNGLRDTYAQAFLILASAWRWRAFKDEGALKTIGLTVDFLQQELKAESGGWLEGLPSSLPRRQNPHMHLFEAFLTVYEATDDKVYLDLASSIFNLFEQYFFDHETEILHEYFTQDWQIEPLSKEAIEPGHMFEWCWLLYWFEKHQPGKAALYAEKLFRKAHQIGINPATGLVVNKVTIDGRMTDNQSRLWPQTEFVKASMARMRLGHGSADEDGTQMIDLIFKYYLGTPIAGGWHDLRDNDGALINTPMSSSTFYHLIGMAVEVDRTING